jgi:hypothetical protein
MIKIHINEGNIKAGTGAENSSGIGWESGRTCTPTCCN